MNEGDLAGLPYRNRLINEAFAQVLPPKEQLVNEEVDDQTCERIIATRIRDLCQRRDEEERRNGFVQIWGVELKAPIIRRDGIVCELHPAEFELIKMLLEAAVEAETGEEKSTPFTSNAKVMTFYPKYARKRGCRKELSLLNKALKVIGLEAASTSRRVNNGKKEFGRRIKVITPTDQD